MLGEKNLNITYKPNGVKESVMLGSPSQGISKDLKMERSVEEFTIRKGKVHN